LRLTGGALKGKKVKARGLGKSSSHGALRATSAKVRESVFNIIGPLITDSVFIDLFAGSGTMGMEAMSRGAGSVYFIESDRDRARSLEDTLNDCGCMGKAIIRSMRSEDFISFAKDESIKADIIFLDPPYGYDSLHEVIELLGEGELLTNDSLVIAEHSKRETLPDTAGKLLKAKVYKYGDTILSLYRKD
jgi:16S rRNA (guanine(966)-N(2))-methyltransferase RsmD